MLLIAVAIFAYSAARSPRLIASFLLFALACFYALKYWHYSNFSPRRKGDAPRSDAAGRRDSICRLR